MTGMHSKSDVVARVRQIYVRRPYPAVEPAQKKLRPIWRIAPMPWIEAMWEPTRAEPRRILVAGCGTGNEAFGLRALFPAAEIVGVDFCARSIKLARRLQSQFSRRKKTQFITADVTSAGFQREIGGRFDFVSCHGVLSYIPNAEGALQNLASALAENGALYLGVNGGRHFSEAWRPVLREFGVDADEFRDDPRLRDLLKLCDALASDGLDIASRRPEYLASDLFGPVIANRPLEKWLDLAQACGLHFRGSYAAHRTLRQVLNAELYELLLPRTRAEAHCVAERIAPASFHYLVLTRKAAATSRWPRDGELLRCRVLPTNLYTTRLPKPRARAGKLRQLILKSAATNTRADLRVPGWVIDLLGETNGQRKLNEILGPRARRIASRSLRRELYLLYLLGAINVAPE
jgi:SAM-dependent methyltransferase